MPNYARLPTFSKSFTRVVVETPRGAAAKLSYDADLRVFEYSHPLPAGITYPYDWGFIPSTLGQDGDPLDGLVVHEAASAPGVVIQCQLLGSIQIEQKEDGETFRNDRFIFCPVKEDAEDEREVADGLPDDLKAEIEQFFQASVLNSKKKIKFKGWQSAKKAMAALKKGKKAFQRKSG